MTRFSKVVPAILTDDPESLEVMIRQAEAFTGYVQVDIMDGQFVPSRSITVKHLHDITIKLEWEAHLMVMSPENYFEEFRRAGTGKVVFHYEATDRPDEVIARARKIGLGVGLAINPETPVSDTLPLLSEVDSVLLLTVNPGYYGAPFIPEVMDKVAELRAVRLDMEIGVDGGIKEGNIAEVARKGVDMICVGSAVFLQPQPGESYRHLQALANSGR
jgi:ribulose-phosphate 3-epimerase